MLILRIFVQLIIGLLPFISFFPDSFVLPYYFFHPFPSVFDLILGFRSLDMVYFLHHIRKAPWHSLYLFVFVFKIFQLHLFFAQFFIQSINFQSHFIHLINLRIKAVILAIWLIVSELRNWTMLFPLNLGLQTLIWLD